MLKVYTSFNDYVADHPDSEHFRNWLTHFGEEPDLIIFESPVRAFSGALPGSFYWVCTAEMRDKHARVIIQGCDDGMLVLDVNNIEEALAEVKEIPLQDFHTFEWFEKRGYQYE